MLIETLSVRKYKVGYELRTELWRPNENFEPIKVKVCYTPDGAYIGDSKFTRYLILTLGIKPQKSQEEHPYCSIGFSEKEQKWYGWSHRGILGFGVGNKVFQKSFGDENTPFIEHGNEVIETLEQAKRAAMNFAEYLR